MVKVGPAHKRNGAATRTASKQIPQHINAQPCASCPLQSRSGLRPLTTGQIAFMQDFKQGELNVEAGTHILVQGTISPMAYTLLDGILVRFRDLEDGRRQIVNFMFPGDLVGLQAAMNEPVEHGVEALTSARLCIFSRDRFLELYRNEPKLGFDITWLAATEEAALEEHLVTLGRRRAGEKIAYLALFLLQRGVESGLSQGLELSVTITQSQIADMLGFSLVHVNRTLQTLRKQKILDWTLDQLRIQDPEETAKYARFDFSPSRTRPFI